MYILQVLLLVIGKHLITTRGGQANWKRLRGFHSTSERDVFSGIVELSLNGLTGQTNNDCIQGNTII